MSDDKLSMLARLGRLLRRKGRSPAQSRASSAAKDAPSDEADSANFPYRPGREEIQVVEIDSMEFVQEWGRTVAIQVEAQAHSAPAQQGFIDRRLPNFDRRNPGHNRRAGDGQDRRHAGLSRPVPVVILDDPNA